jgi:predicted amidohydrolase
MPAAARCLRVAVAQFTARAWDVRGNLARMRDLLAAAAADQAGLVCFPELCLPGYLLDPAGYTDGLLSELGQAEAALHAAASDLRLRIVYGTVRGRPGCLRNVVVLTEPDGGCTVYAKAHMVTAERAVFTAGREAVLSADGDLALGCCYDLAFPQFCAGLADNGARVLLFPMAWECRRAFVFEGIAAARAIENITYLVCANQSGSDGDIRFHGGSRIVDPLGNTLAGLAGAAGISSAEVDLDWVTRLRSAADPGTYPLLADRRPNLTVRRVPIRAPRVFTKAVDFLLAGTLNP